MDNSLTILVPFRNESKTLEPLVLQLESLREKLDFICIFVNDGSTDSSVEILKLALSKSGLQHQLISKISGGKASAVFEGSKYVTTSHVVILDADLELDAKDIIRMWEVVERNQNNYIFGYRRFLAHSAFTYRYTIGNKLISHTFGILFNQVITDIMCGLKLVPSEFLKNLPFKHKRFAIEVEIPIKMWRLKIRPFEIDVNYYPRGWSDGKTIGFQDAIQIFFVLLVGRIRK